MDVSIVILCYKNERSLRGLLLDIEDTLVVLGRDFELIVINDGSGNSPSKDLAELAPTTCLLGVSREMHQVSS